MSGKHSQSVLISHHQSINSSRSSLQRDMSQPRAFKGDHNLMENHYQSTKSFDAKSAGVYTTRRSCTPNFGFEQSGKITTRQGLEKELDLLSSSRKGTRNMSGIFGVSESNSEVQTFGKKPKVPKLPLDSLLEEDSEQASLNLSAIGAEISIKNINPHNQNQDDSFMLLKMLEQEAYDENNTLNLSPVINHKTYSRLDESSIVGPQCKILIEKPYFDNKENVHNVQSTEIKLMLKKQSQKYDKALIVLQAQFVSYKDFAEKQIFMLTQELASIKSEISSLNRFKDRAIEIYRSQIDSLKSSYADKFNDYLQEIEQKILESDLHRNSSQAKIDELQKEYNQKIQTNEQSIFNLKKQNEDLKEQIGKPGEDKDYEELIRENKKLREELTILWKDYGRSRLRIQV